MKTLETVGGLMKGCELLGIFFFPICLYFLSIIRKKVMNCEVGGEGIIPQVSGIKSDPGTCYFIELTHLRTRQVFLGSGPECHISQGGY